MDAWKADSSFSSLAKLSDFAERISYDANGNILQYQRNGNQTFAGKPLGMDSLTYSYLPGTNQLDHISDSVNASNYTEDIDKQAAGNYGYDAIGNLVKDSAGGIKSINWTVYGKIDNILKNDGSTIKYLYDAAGNRISKTVLKGGITTATGYVRDASGNVMSVYTATDTVSSGHLLQSEVDLYGSSRLGIWKPGIDVDYLTPPTDTIVPLLGTGYSLTFARGNKLFELSNHLGNVLTTLSDKKLQHTSDSATVDYYKPDVVSAQDYYPFGMGVPGRSYSSGGSYRYGFNGKEKDGNMDGNNYDYGFRIYNPQIGRFLSTDPLEKKYPELTPYQFASNRPIDGIDLDGLEYTPSIEAALDKVSRNMVKKATSAVIQFFQNRHAQGINNYMIADFAQKEEIKQTGHSDISGYTKSLVYLGAWWYGGHVNNLVNPVQIAKDAKEDFQEGHYILGSIGLVSILPGLGELQAIKYLSPESKALIKVVGRFNEASKEIAIATKSGMLSDALNIAKDLTGAIPKNATAVYGRQGSLTNELVGYQWRTEDGIFKRIRLDNDLKVGTHINVSVGKQKYSILVNTSQEQAKNLGKNEIMKTVK